MEVRGRAQAGGADRGQYEVARAYSARESFDLLRNLGRNGLTDNVQEALHELDRLPDPGDVPVTMAWGSRDWFTPRSPHSRISSSSVGNVPVVSMPGCGHLMAWDDPERVALLAAKVSRPPVETA